VLTTSLSSAPKKGFVADIEALTERNNDFRRVIYTGKYLQLVLSVDEHFDAIARMRFAERCHDHMWPLIGTAHRVATRALALGNGPARLKHRQRLSDRFGRLKRPKDDDSVYQGRSLAPAPGAHLSRATNG
jgi:hypothetical protein